MADALGNILCANACCLLTVKYELQKNKQLLIFIHIFINLSESAAFEISTTMFPPSFGEVYGTCGGFVRNDMPSPIK